MNLAKNFELSLDFFNQRVGEWEPVIEPWKLALTVAKTDTLTDLNLRAQSPLLINLTPTTVRTVGWYLPW